MLVIPSSKLVLEKFNLGYINSFSSWNYLYYVLNFIYDHLNKSNIKHRRKWNTRLIYTSLFLSINNRLYYHIKYNDEDKTISITSCTDIKCSITNTTMMALNFRKKSLAMSYAIMAFIRVPENGNLNQTRRIYNIYGIMII